VQGLQADRGRCESLVEESLAMCTALAPVIGYDRAAPQTEPGIPGKTR
jgi:fumarate hydratase, class II